MVSIKAHLSGGLSSFWQTVTVGNCRSRIGAAIESRVVMTGASLQSEKEVFRRYPDDRNPAMMINP